MFPPLPAVDILFAEETRRWQRFILQLQQVVRCQGCEICWVTGCRGEWPVVEDALNLTAGRSQHFVVEGLLFHDGEECLLHQPDEPFPHSSEVGCMWWIEEPLDMVGQQVFLDLILGQLIVRSFQLFLCRGEVGAAVCTDGEYIASPTQETPDGVNAGTCVQTCGYFQVDGSAYQTGEEYTPALHT